MTRINEKVNGNREHTLYPVMELLTLIIESYDDAHSVIDEPDGISMLKYSMKEYGL